MLWRPSRQRAKPPDHCDCSGARVLRHRTAACADLATVHSAATEHDRLRAHCWRPMRPRAKPVVAAACAHDRNCPVHPHALTRTEKASCQWTNLATVRSAPNELTRRQSVRERCVSASGRDRSQIQARQCGESPRIPAIALSNQTATALTSRPSTQPRHSATSSQGDSPCESAVSVSKQTVRIETTSRGCSCTHVHLAPM